MSMSAQGPPIATPTAQHPPQKSLKGNQTQPRTGRSARLPLRVFVLSHPLRTQTEQLSPGVVLYADGRLGLLRCLLNRGFAVGLQNRLRPALRERTLAFARFFRRKPATARVAKTSAVTPPNAVTSRPTSAIQSGPIGFAGLSGSARHEGPTHPKIASCLRAPRRPER